MRRLLPTVGLVAALLVPDWAQAAPLDDKIQLLRARPTGMEEAEWRRQRRDVARELGESRNQKAVDALIEVVETERYDAVLSIAIEGLGKQGDSRAIAPLQKIYADRSLDTFVREDAAKAIRALGGTPRDDARLTGEGGGTTGTGDEGLVQGPQLGTMGAASAPDEELPPPKRKKPLPENLRARDRSLEFGTGALDLRINTLDVNQSVNTDAQFGAYAYYVDDRNGWGWSAQGALTGSVANGDFQQNGGDPDVADSLWFRQSLSGNAEAHVYIKESNWHGFIGAGVSERLSMIRLNGDDDQMVAESEFTDSRFALDIIPALGIGWGRYLNAGGDMMVEAIADALEAENILARPIDDAGRKAIQYAIFDYANDRASYPRMAAALNVLRQRGYLARSPSPRLIYRLIRIVDDPSYVNRMRGPRVRVGFLYGLPVGQGSYVGRNADAAAAGPFVQFNYGIQIDKEREIQIDTRIFYDALFDVTGYSTDTGAMYRRNFHGKYQDYLGAWYLGLRGGVSSRNNSTIDPPPDDSPGYSAMGSAGYAYMFNRGSSIDAGLTAGVESGAFIVGFGLGFRFGVFHASVVNGGGSSKRGKKAAAKANAEGEKTEAGASGKVEVGTGGK